MMKTNGKPRDHPRRPYTIIMHEDNIADIYLESEVYPITTDDGVTDYDVRISVIRGIDTEGRTVEELEEDIRRRYEAYREAAESIYL